MSLECLKSPSPVPICIPGVQRICASRVAGCAFPPRLASVGNANGRLIQYLALAAALPALLLGVCFSDGLSAADKPNIVFIMVDDMGYGDPGCYNPESKIRTPQIDAVAAHGMRFTDAHAPGPLCHMSRFGLLTGQYPFRADVEGWRTKPSISPNQTTLASMLKQQGYHTAMVGKWHLGFAENGYDQPLPGGPVDVGFDSFFGIRASTDIPPYFYIRGDRAVEPPTVPIAARNTEGWTNIQGEFWREGLIAPSMKLEDVLPRFTDEAVSVIEQHVRQNSEVESAASGKPLFLYLAFPAPHTPWLPSAKFAGKSQVPLYGDFAEMVDAMIGHVLDTLEATGLSDDTLLFITSDNGPVWYEADVGRFGHDSAGGLRGMKADAWEAGHRMPFVVRWPKVVAEGSVSEQTICFTDVLATLAALTGYELSAEDAPDSFDFSAELRGSLEPGASVRDSLVMRSGGGMMTVRQHDWKLIDGLGSGGFSQPRRIQPQPGEPAVQLYNLREDPVENVNLAKQRPEIVEQLRLELERVQQAGRHR